MWRRLLLVMLVASGFVALRPAGQVLACSCIASTVSAAVADGEVVVVGRPTEHRGPDANGEHHWTFEVTDVVKGDTDAEIVVRGGDWGAGCGTDFSTFAGPILVALQRDGDDLVHPGCSPVGTRDDLLTALAPLEEPDGAGPVAALVAQRYRWANLAALDASGRVLSWGDIGGAITAVAGCPGSDRAVAEVADSEGSLALAIVDLRSMTVVAEHPVSPPAASELVCVPTAHRDAPVVVRSGGGLLFDGQAGIGVLSNGTASGTLLSDVADLVVLTNGTAYAFPASAGAPVTRFTGTEPTEHTLEPLPDGDVVIAAEVGPSDRIAALVADAVRGAAFDTGATALALFEVDADGSLVRTARHPLPDGGLGSAQTLRWLDGETLAVVRSTVDGAMQLDVVGLDGTLRSRADVPWGDGPHAIGGAIGGELLRASDGGLERIAPDGTVTALIPAPNPELYAPSARLAIVTDGPMIPSLRPDPPAVHEPRSIAAPATTAPEDETTASTEPPAAPASDPATDPPAVTGPATTTAGASSDGDDGDSDLPVVPITIALLVAAVAAAVAVAQARRPR